MLRLGMPDWLLEVIGCARPECGGKLTLVLGGVSRRGIKDGMLACSRCRSRYPVVGGVPVVVPDPDQWAAAYYDAALAALVEHGAASQATVALLKRFAGNATHVPPMRFSDDWVEGENAQPEVVGAAAEAFRVFLGHARSAGPEDELLGLLPRTIRGTVVDVGCGAGQLARALRPRVERLVVCDLSLRAVLRARANPGRRGAEIAGAVVDAEQLPLRRRSVDVVVAAQLVDLLDRPSPFLHAVGQALRRGGSFALATPDPALGSGGEEALAALIDSAGMRVEAEVDGVPWVHAHRPRFFEVYFTRVLLARRR